MAKRFPLKNSNRPKEGGILVASKQDLLAHSDGTAFKHDADNILMNPLLSVGGDNVQEALENVLLAATSSGSGFISIGQVGGSLGSYNVGASPTMTLPDTFDAAFADPRLVDGGVVLLMAGQYDLVGSQTINVPPGITIIGEDAGTIINKSGGDDKNMFRILAGATGTDIGGTIIDPITVIRSSDKDSVKLMNIVLVDNLGGVTDKNPYLVTSPMIVCEIGSSFVCNNVKFIGRVGDAISNPLITNKAIDYVVGESRATHLEIVGCYFDGLRTGVQYNGLNSSDIIHIENCKARTYGDDSDIVASKNCFVGFNIANATFIGNHHIGAGINSNYCFVINSFNPSSVGRKIVIIGNSGSVSASSDLVNDILSIPSGALTLLEVIKNANSWCSNGSNEWFVVIGNVGSNGDLVGSWAADVVAVSASNIPTTCIVNPGIYKLTSYRAGSKNINFKSNSTTTPPVFDLSNIYLGLLDAKSNPTFNVGNSIEGIKFINTSGAFRTLTVNGDAYARVVDCEFDNVGLTNTADKLYLSGCKFNQTINSTNVVLYNPEESIIDNCSWIGDGLAGELGVVNISNCNMIVGSISAASGFGYLTMASCTMRDCKVDAGSGSAGLGGIYYIIYSGDINISNSYLIGFDHTYNVSGEMYYINLLYVASSGRSNIVDSKFSGKCVLLSIYSEENTDLINVEENTFETYSDASFPGTMVYLYAGSVNDNLGKVNFLNNNIMKTGDSSLTTNISALPLSQGSSVNFGAVCIRTYNVDIFAVNNTINVTQTMYDMDKTIGYSYSALLIENDTDNSTKGSFTFIDGNNIQFRLSNYYNDATQTNSCYKFSGINVMTASNSRISKNSVRMDGKLIYSGPGLTNPYYSYTGISYSSENYDQLFYYAIISENSCASGLFEQDLKDIGKFTGINASQAGDVGIIVNNIVNTVGPDSTSIANKVSWTVSGNIT